jgi:small subunit ribosomal protein S12
MATINQIVRGKRKKLKKRKVRTSALEGCPQSKGVCLRTLTRNPKKPNSALRKVAKIRLSNKKIIYAHIPGVGHNLQEHGVVLIRGGRAPDLPGIKYRCIRGKFDLGGVVGRTTSRSKYGVPKPR